MRVESFTYSKADTIGEEGSDADSCTQKIQGKVTFSLIKDRGPFILFSLLPCTAIKCYVGVMVFCIHNISNIGLLIPR